MAAVIDPRAGVSLALPFIMSEFGAGPFAETAAAQWRGRAGGTVEYFDLRRIVGVDRPEFDPGIAALRIQEMRASAAAAGRDGRRAVADVVLGEINEHLGLAVVIHVERPGRRIFRRLQHAAACRAFLDHVIERKQDEAGALARLRFGFGVLLVEAGGEGKIAGPERDRDRRLFTDGPGCGSGGCFRLLRGVLATGAEKQGPDQEAENGSHALPPAKCRCRAALSHFFV